MRIYEKRQIPAREDTLCVRRKCDLCGLEAKSSGWDCGNYEIDETQVSVTVKDRKGENYPECGMGTEYNIDLCPKCFRDRLIPWLQSQGAEIEPVEWDW